MGMRRRDVCILVRIHRHWTEPCKEVIFQIRFLEKCRHFIQTSLGHLAGAPDSESDIYQKIQLIDCHQSLPLTLTLTSPQMRATLEIHHLQSTPQSHQGDLPDLGGFSSVQYQCEFSVQC